MYQVAVMWRIVTAPASRRFCFCRSVLKTGTSERATKLRSPRSIVGCGGSGSLMSPNVLRCTKWMCALSKLFSISRNEAQAHGS